MTRLPLYAGITVLGALARGTWHRNSALFGRVLHRLPGEGKRVALTFDDGPNAEATPAILDALREARAPATFFLVGRAVERFPALARRIADEGHQLGNLGYAHDERTVGWSLGVRDSSRPGADVIAERVARGVRPGSIVLLHDGDDLAGDRRQTAAALPAIIERLRADGYAFVPLPAA